MGAKFVKFDCHRCHTLLEFINSIEIKISNININNYIIPIGFTSIFPFIPIQM